MNIDDFRYMWRGKTLKALNNHEAHLLEPINVQGQGAHNALLLLHGFSSSPAVFRELIPSLLPLYETIVCPTLPGHGESISSFSQVKSKDWVKAAEALCAGLMEKYPTVDLLGFSLGGLLACHLSQRFTLHHLYLLAPALALHLNIKWALKAAHALHYAGFQQFRNRAGSLLTQLHSEIAYRQLPITTIIEILNFIQEFQHHPPECPTDLFLGRHDDVVNSTIVANHFKHLPKSQLHWLENSAHVLPLDGDIDAIVACIRQNQALK
jgi:carboxylesterase